MKKNQKLSFLVGAVLALICIDAHAFGSKRTQQTMRPVDANRYEGLLRYSCKGELKWSFTGTGSCHYAAGDEIDLWVKVPPVHGQVVARSMRKEQVTDFDKDGWVKLHWKFDDRDGIPIIVGVAGYGSGIQMSKLYPYVADASMKGKVKYYCYEDGGYRESEGQGQCQQPAGGRVDGSVLLDASKAGQYLIQSKGCVLESPGEQKGAFKAGTDRLDIAVSRADKGFCLVRSNVKYDDGSISEHELYLDWFDPAYLPLSPPRLRAKNQKSVEACGPQGWEWYELNGQQWEDCLFTKSCHSKPWIPEGWAYALGWDKNGRTSWATTIRRGEQ